MKSIFYSLASVFSLVSVHAYANSPSKLSPTYDRDEEAVVGKLSYMSKLDKGILFSISVDNKVTGESIAIWEEIAIKINSQTYVLKKLGCTITLSFGEKLLEVTTKGSCERLATSDVGFEGSYYARPTFAVGSYKVVHDSVKRGMLTILPSSDEKKVNFSLEVAGGPSGASGILAGQTKLVQGNALYVDQEGCGIAFSRITRSKISVSEYSTCVGHHGISVDFNGEYDLIPNDETYKLVSCSDNRSLDINLQKEGDVWARALVIGGTNDVYYLNGTIASANTEIAAFDSFRHTFLTSLNTPFSDMTVASISFTGKRGRNLGSVLVTNAEGTVSSYESCKVSNLKLLKLILGEQAASLVVDP